MIDMLALKIDDDVRNIANEFDASTNKWRITYLAAKYQEFLRDFRVW